MLLPLAAAAMLFHPAPPPLSPPPRLVVLIVVDQLRPDYFTRFAGQLGGGLGRLHRGGAFFPNAIQDHAVTQTAPGHATLLSGRFPAHTGIMLNERGVPDSLAPLLGVPRVVGASPRRFNGTTLYDWMLRRDPDARVLSVSRKDRGAILPVGRARGDVYWWSMGQFTTSTYYRDVLPDWVQAYNARRSAERFAGKQWELLRQDDTTYREPDAQPGEGDGHEPTFPHPITGDLAQVGMALEEVPWMDSLTLDFALRGVHETGIGRRDRPDLLVVSLSTLDAIGHDYGPDSREVHDHFLRLDGWLGAFLDSLGTIVPPERTLLALTGDHGMVSSPDLARQRGRPGGRIWLDSIATRVRLASLERWHTGFDVEFDDGIVLADTDEMRRRRIPVDSIANALARQVRAMPGIAKVFTPASLRAATNDPHAALWRRSIPAGQGWLIAAEPKEGWIWATRPRQSNHGAPHPGDMGIPIAIVGPGIRPAVHRRKVRSVDLAPTLAALLGIAPTEPLDGEPLAEVVRARAVR